eukprot:gene8335-159_t
MNKLCIVLIALLVLCAFSRGSDIFEFEEEYDHSLDYMPQILENENIMSRPRPKSAGKGAESRPKAKSAGKGAESRPKSAGKGAESKPKSAGKGAKSRPKSATTEEFAQPNEY